MSEPRKKILFLMALAALYSLGIEVRTHYFREMGHRNSERYWMESAQRFRHAQMVADGASIPELDLKMQMPDGLITRKDTIFEEQLAGMAYRGLQAIGLISDLPFYIFIRYFLRAFYSLGIIAVAFIFLEFSGSYLAALIASFIFAFALVSTSRAMASTIYREHIAIPFMAFHVYFFLKGGRTQKWREEVFSSLFLLLALISWKVMKYYYFAFVVYMAFEIHLGVFFSKKDAKEPANPGLMRTLLIHTAVICVASLVLDTHLRYDRFALSLPMVASYALILSVIASMALKDRVKGIKFGFIGASMWVIMFLILYAVIPKTGGYEHVYETVLYKLRYWTKPDNPELLSFHARHYWGGPYDTPSLYRFMSHMSIVLALCAYPLFSFGRKYIRGETPPRSSYMLYGALVFLMGYLTFYKLQTFTIFFLSFFLGYFYILIMSKEGVKRLLLALIMLAGMAIELNQTVNAGDTFYSRSLIRAGIRRPPSNPAYTPRHAKENMYLWLKKNTSENDTVLASFFISPSILTYAERPVILNCFFESTEMLDRYREHAEALFADEEALYSMAKKYKAKYVLIDAGMLLRDDKDLSFRYVAAAGPFSERWTIYKMHFAPETLKYFDLLYQNDFMRIFEVGKAYSGRALPLKAIFSKDVFDKVTAGDASKTSGFYRRYLKAYKRLIRGQLVDASEGPMSASVYFKEFAAQYPEMPEGYINMGTALARAEKFKDAIKALNMAVEMDPRNAELFATIGMLQSDIGDKEKALLFLNRALEIEPAMKRPLIELAMIYFKGKEFDSAEAYFQKVLASRPGDLDALKGLDALKRARETIKKEPLEEVP